ncbi:MAG: hypothetical protein WAV92_06460 [Halopseudomonas yangmingensis]|uniref:Uncharacterized protein n=1 Tax=Halopseudomonas yangmingensis TaxID=1720063 RepID=A0A1I4TG81_9GAMM|nr:hypothetical protein [Halopseudomonas yangmingensis]SFM75726.1 hypothetical protein SAMN05216217_11437 [Halopseudomonas yangmingensis]
MSKTADFRAIERQLAEQLAALERKQPSRQPFSEQLQTLMREYSLSAADVAAILESSQD